LKNKSNATSAWTYWFIDWLIVYCFTSRSRIFHLYGDVTIAGEGMQNLGLCSALRAFEQGGIFIVPHLLWHGTSIFSVSSDRRTAPFSRLLRHTRGCERSILTRIHTDRLNSLKIMNRHISHKVIISSVLWIVPFNCLLLYIQEWLHTVKNVTTLRI
jgi:hypothetical protein